MHLYCKLPDDFSYKKPESTIPPSTASSKTTTITKRTATASTATTTIINSPLFTPVISVYDPYPTPFGSKTGTANDADRILNIIPTPDSSFKYLNTARSIPERPITPVPSRPTTPPEDLPERPKEPTPPPTAVQQLVLPSPIETPPHSPPKKTPTPHNTPPPPPPQSPPHSPIIVKKKEEIEENDEYLVVPNDLKHPLDRIMKKYIDSQRDIEMPEKMFKAPIYELNSLAPVFGELTLLSIYSKQFRLRRAAVYVYLFIYYYINIDNSSLY